MTAEQQQRIEEFIKNYDLGRISRNIRKIFFDYLRQQNAGLPMDFDEVLYDVEVAIQLLEELSSG